MKRYIFSIVFLCLSLIGNAQNSPVKINVVSCERSGYDVLLTTTITNKQNKTVKIDIPASGLSDDRLKTYAYGDSSNKINTYLEKWIESIYSVEAPNGVPLKAVIRLKDVPKELKKINSIIYIIKIDGVPYYTLLSDVAITDGPNPEFYRNTDMVKLGETKPGTTLKVYESY